MTKVISIPFFLFFFFFFFAPALFVADSAASSSASGYREIRMAKVKFLEKFHIYIFLVGTINITDARSTSHVDYLATGEKS